MKNCISKITSILIIMLTIINFNMYSYAVEEDGSPFNPDTNIETSTTVYIDCVEVKFDEPLIKLQNTTLVPFSIFETIGSKVEYGENLDVKVTHESGDQQYGTWVRDIVSFYMGAEKAIGERTTQTMDDGYNYQNFNILFASPCPRVTYYKGTLYVPLSVVCGWLDYEFGYSSDPSKIFIFSKEKETKNITQQNTPIENPSNNQSNTKVNNTNLTDGCYDSNGAKLSIGDTIYTAGGVFLGVITNIVDNKVLVQWTGVSPFAPKEMDFSAYGYAVGVNWPLPSISVYTYAEMSNYTK